MPRYVIKCWIPVDPPPDDQIVFPDVIEARKELNQLKLIQPENIYTVEELPED